MIGFEVTVEGSFSEQHPLVKVGSGIASLLFILFGNYVPLALAVWLILTSHENPLQPDYSIWAWLFLTCFLASLFALGSWLIINFMNWFADGYLSRGQLLIAIVLISCLSVTVAVAAFIFSLWTTLLLGAFAGIIISAIVSILVIGIGQALEKQYQKN